jgi:hypothetical protein
MSGNAEKYSWSLTARFIPKKFDTVEKYNVDKSYACVSVSIVAVTTTTTTTTNNNNTDKSRISNLILDIPMCYSNSKN